MLTCFLRSALMVNDEMPMSYLPPWTPVMIVLKVAGCHSTVTPNFCATASNRSTSMPTTVFPPCRNSFGRYVASTPTTILPAALIFGGSEPLRSGPELDGALEGALEGAVDGDDDEPFSREFEPQPAAA